MRSVDPDRLRELADRPVGWCRRVLSDVVFQLVTIAIGVSVGGIVGIVFAAAEMPMLLAIVVGIAVAFGVAWVADAAWCRAAGLRRPGRRPADLEDEDVEGGFDDTEADAAGIDPAVSTRVSDCPEVAAR